MTCQVNIGRSLERIMDVETVHETPDGKWVVFIFYNKDMHPVRMRRSEVINVNVVGFALPHPSAHSPRPHALPGESGGNP